MNMNSNPFEELEKRLVNMTNILMEIKESMPRESFPGSNPKHQKLVKIDEAAIITGYKKTYLYELVQSKGIPFIRRGRSLRFDPDELDDWMKAGRPNVIKKTISMLKEQVVGN